MSSPAAANGTLRPPPGALCPALTGRPGQFHSGVPPDQGAGSRRRRGTRTPLLSWESNGSIHLDGLASQGGVPAEWKRRFGRISEALGGGLSWVGFWFLGLPEETLAMNDPRESKDDGNLPCSWHLLLSLLPCPRYESRWCGPRPRPLRASLFIAIKARTQEAKK